MTLNETPTPDTDDSESLGENWWWDQSASRPMYELIKSRKAALASLDDNSGEPWPKFDPPELSGPSTLGSDPIVAEKMASVLNIPSD